MNNKQFSPINNVIANIIRNCKPMTNDVELAMFTEYCNTKNQAIRDKIFNANTKLVLSICNRIRFSNESVNDLFGEASIALLKAIEEYNVTKGYRFSVYATSIITNAIFHYRVNNGSVIRNPKMTKLYGVITRINNEFSQKNGRYPIDSELVDILIERGYKVDVSDITTPQVSTMVNSDEDDVIENNEVEVKTSVRNSIEDVIDNESLSSRIKSKLSILNDKEKFVIMMAFGFNGVEYDFPTIADKMGISDEGVRKIYKKSLIKMQKAV